MNVCLLFKNMQEYHFIKDVYLFPKYIAKNLNCSLSIAYSRNKNIFFKDNDIDLELNNVYKDFLLNFNFLQNILLILFILKNSKKLDILVLFHYTIFSLVICFIYKLRNRKGFVYIKGDMDMLDATEIDCSRGFRRIYLILKSKIKIILSSNVDLFSVESLEVYNFILHKNNEYNFKEIKYISNGFEITNEDLSPLNKENIIITVGRLGTQQKNTKFLLDVISQINLKDWKFYLIGSVNESFKSEIDKFYFENPDFINKVIFLGSIEDRDLLKNYYKKAKVFISTSLWESYGLVFLEAVFYKNFLISNSVGAASDLIKLYNFDGKILDLEQKKYIDYLQEVINGDIKLANYYQVDKDFSLDINYVIKPIIESYMSLQNIRKLMNDKG
ncbi:glycosyltransferase family 4 protein [Acinetobacter johnsonii]|uniref:glycosyltransferase n=1 Tax=Acinetobacter johnsonii TaxID=40214 RepID=UPI00244BD199|nr:glycosyltransferase [Acinetobacter johnsonii]MDH2045884.1 glycosyltransferase family 4 protein [Acinetobacter johnsonii]